MIHPPHVFFTPDIKVEVSEFPQLKRANVMAELVLCSNYLKIFVFNLDNFLHAHNEIP